MMEPWAPGSFCQISSVMKGMKGCSSLRTALSTRSRTPWQWRRAAGVFFVVELGLDEFQVPVAELVPDELVKRVGRLIEVVGVQRRAGLPDDLLEAAHDPGLHRGFL